MEKKFNKSSPNKWAVIWDMDGVIVDTAILHFQAWQQLMAELNITLTFGRFLPTFGRKNADILRDLIGGQLTAQEIETLSDRKEKYFRDKIDSTLQPLPGVRKLVTSLSWHGFDQAIGSSAPPENIAEILKVLELTDFFKVVISAADIQQGKPHPQVFLKAAESLGIEPMNCVVIEDAPAGVQAGLAAGMKVIAVTNTWSKENLNHANLVVDSLENVNIETFRNLLLNVPVKGFSPRI